MAYTKTTWVNRLGTNLNKFTKSSETSTTVILQNTPDSITQAGTEFSAARMNNIETGIDDVHNNDMTFAGAKTFSSPITVNNITDSNQILELNTTPTDGTDGQIIRLFRSTNTTGEVSLDITIGSGGSTSAQHSFKGKDGSTSYIASRTGSKLAIGKTTASKQLDVAGDGAFGGLLTASGGATVSGVLQSTRRVWMTNAGRGYASALSGSLGNTTYWNIYRAGWYWLKYNSTNNTCVRVYVRDDSGAWIQINNAVNPLATTGPSFTIKDGFFFYVPPYVNDSNSDNNPASSGSTSSSANAYVSGDPGNPTATLYQLPV